MPQIVSAFSPTFTISDPDSVTLDSPNSGTFAHNQSISISWTKTNFTNNVDLYWTTSTTFSTSNNIVFNYNANSYSWNIPSSVSGQSIYIWVRKTGDSAVKDRSNNAISITGITLNTSINETLASSDSFTFNTSEWLEIVNINETLTSSDSFDQLSHEYIKARTINETLSLADVWAKDITDFIRFATINETLSTSDSFLAPTRNWILLRIIGETILTGDSDDDQERLWIQVKNIAEQLSVTDSDSDQERTWIKIKSIAEQLATSDSFSLTTRTFKKFVTILETLAPADLDSLGRIVEINDALVFGDSFSFLVSKQGTVYQLNSSNSNEQIHTLYKTGWIMPQPLSKNSIVRRVNLDYTSADPVTLKLYKDDEKGTPFATKTFPSSSTPAHGSIRLATRIKYFQIAIETAQSTNDNVRIERIEIEVDD